MIAEEQPSNAFLSAVPAPPASLPDGWVRAEIAALSACGPVRELNEDRVGWAVIGSPTSARSPVGNGQLVREELTGPGAAVLIADGLGGHAHGELASRTAIGMMLRRLSRPVPPGQLAGTLREGFDAANEAILLGRLDEATGDVVLVDPGGAPGPDAADPQSIGRPMGSRGAQTTLTALAVTASGSQLAHVGDCRLFRLRDGVLELFTSDHTQASELLRMRLIKPEQLARHPGRHLLTRSVGGDIAVRIETRPGVPEVGDTYLLCTDGAWGSADSMEIRSAMEGDLGDGLGALIVRSAERGGDDNASVIALRILDLARSTAAPGLSAWRLPWRRGGTT